MFKKISLIAVFAMLSFCAQAQEKEENEKSSKFGFTAGLINSEMNLDYLLNDPENRPWNTLPYGGTGLFLGITYDNQFSEKFGISSEFIYADVGYDQFRLNALLKYKLFNSKFSLLGGPEINLIERGPDFSGGDGEIGNQFGFDLTGGLEYDINQRISVYGKYSYELTNRYSSGRYEDIYEGNYSGFRFGVKFRF